MEPRYKQSELLLERAETVIPLGSQTFSKSKTHFPFGVSPYFIERGQGARVWDVDGNEYIDFINGLLCVSLGYCDPDVDAAVRAQMEKGVTFSLPHRLEMEVAELLIDTIPCAEMVRFGKNGSDATAASIRLARAYTGRDHVAVCGYHGWHDWYIGSTSRDLGVPAEVRQLTHCFDYNDLASLEAIFDAFPDKVAAVILEPMSMAFPENDFLQRVKALAQSKGAILVFDEMITGFRFAEGGAQSYFGVTPDLATFGKGMANGYPLSAIVGRHDIMVLMEEIFYSGTFAGECLSLAAAKASILKMRENSVIDHFSQLGGHLKEAVATMIAGAGAQDFLAITGHPAWSMLVFEDLDGASALELKTLFLQECFSRGILTNGAHNISYAHQFHDIEQLLAVYQEVFPLMVDAVRAGNVQGLLRAEVMAPLFSVRSQ